MKKILIALAATIALTSAAHADGYWRHGHGPRPGYGYNGGGGDAWVAPLVGGLIIGGMLGAMSQPSYAQPYYYQPAPRYVPRCWTDFVGYDAWGRPVYERVCQ